jgi:hypothetical protein
MLGYSFYSKMVLLGVGIVELTGQKTSALLQLRWDLIVDCKPPSLYHMGMVLCADSAVKYVLPTQHQNGFCYFVDC